MKNSQHLKAYVQMHPDNKMAWYLLGKEYYKSGQEGKANYCFNMAGEVYEAFERSKVPAEMLREYEDGMLKAAYDRHQVKLKRRRMLVALMLAMLVLLPSAVPSGADLGTEAELALALSQAEETAPEPAADDPQEARPELQEEPELGFTAVSGDAAGSGAALAQLLQGEKPDVTAMLTMERSGKWLLWREKLPLAATLVKNANGRAVYQSYDRAACECEPPESAALQQQAGQWQSRQEQLAVLWSAMRAYKNSKGSLPQSPEALTGAFPGNWLAGTTPLMKEAFASVRSAAAAGMTQQPAAGSGDKAPAAGGGEAGGGNAGAAGNGGQELPFLPDRSL